MDIGNKPIQALVLAAVWLAVILAVHVVLRFLFTRYEKRLAERDGSVAARRRTMFDVLRRVVIVLLVLIATWSALSVFPATTTAAKAFLASSAALALILGLALTTPVGNLGSGILLGLTQPLRLGDRITVHMDRGDEHTGIVEGIALTYTTLVTDEGRKIFVPNLVMVRNVVVNHSRGDRSKIVSIRLPVDIDAPIDEACRIAVEAAHEAATGELELDVNVTDVDELTVWLEIEGFAPADADVPRITTEVRKRALAALAEEDLLPAGRRVAERTR
jgi:small-conductance mechanosensitive channel